MSIFNSHGYKPPDGICWNIYVENATCDGFRALNIFRHGGFVQDLQDEIKEYKKTGDTEHFEERLERVLMYFFWCKCEYEIIVSEWPPRTDESRKLSVKVDGYDQIKLNWHVFREYIYKHLNEIEAISFE